MNELKRTHRQLINQLPLLSILAAILFFFAALTYQLNPAGLSFFIILVFSPCVVLSGKKLLVIDR